MSLRIIFILIFIVTDLIRVDFASVQELMTGHDQPPFFILILIVILAYLFKNSKVEMNGTRLLFIIIWNLYVPNIFISMIVNADFIWTEQNGNVGKATGLMTPEEEEYIERHFE